jgi:hypothetical protein
MEDHQTKSEDNVIDSKTFKNNKKLKNDRLLNDIIKEAVLFHKKTDEALQELAEMCTKEINGG